jgi:DNA-binding transcriptional LysR family regulator
MSPLVRHFAGATLRWCDTRSSMQRFDASTNGWKACIFIRAASASLMTAFGQGGAGIFIAPTAIANELVQQYGVEVVGSTDAVVESFYAISTQRIISNPAVAAINATAKAWLK